MSFFTKVGKLYWNSHENAKDHEFKKQIWAKRIMLQLSAYLISNHTTKQYKKQKQNQDSIGTKPGMETSRIE